MSCLPQTALFLVMSSQTLAGGKVDVVPSSWCCSGLHGIQQGKEERYSGEDEPPACHSEHLLCHGAHRAGKHPAFSAPGDGGGFKQPLPCYFQNAI